ncbi:TRAP transporter small permease [Tetragenococcus halophilus]|uniref:TRAP transporter small permease n=1 Tax=Tetragenococcus halophilus TaxID=51669 RepID=UPI0015B8BBFF|nr:TRAP transporter small permease [Tetragenococcus halophilus]NWO00509.1 TRAP transporter small permease [Tetragenococcus halophilus]
MKTVRIFLNKLLELSCSIILVVMVVLVLYQVFSRTILNSPNTATEELVRFGLVWLSMLGSAYVVGKKGHLAVTILSDHLRQSNKQVLETVVQILFLVFASSVMIYGGWKAVSVSIGQTSSLLSISMGYVALSIPVSGVIMFTYSLLDLLEQKELKESEDN